MEIFKLQVRLHICWKSLSLSIFLLHQSHLRTSMTVAMRCHTSASSSCLGSLMWCPTASCLITWSRTMWMWMTSPSLMSMDKMTQLLLCAPRALLVCQKALNSLMLISSHCQHIWGLFYFVTYLILNWESCWDKKCNLILLLDTTLNVYKKRKKLAS